MNVGGAGKFVTDIPINENDENVCLSRATEENEGMHNVVDWLEEETLHLKSDCQQQQQQLLHQWITKSSTKTFPGLKRKRQKEKQRDSMKKMKGKKEGTREKKDIETLSTMTTTTSTMTTDPIKKMKRSALV